MTTLQAERNRSAAGDLPFGFSRTQNLPECARVYESTGHVRIPGFLDGRSADGLRAALLARDDWRQIINQGDKIFEIDRPTRRAMDAAKARELDRAVFAQATQGFQHRYEAIRAPEEGDDPLAALVAWMSTGSAIAALKAITGCDDIDFADGQATLYEAGDFLTAHDDAVAGKGRVAAYVLGLTPAWRLDWGGLLMLHGPDGSARAYPPGYNTLDLFAVPQPHSVSLVSPAASGSRLSVTGWLRTRG